MSILTELKKLTKKKNATVVSQALPDSLDGSGSGSGGGGANVLTLYSNNIGDGGTAYKNSECTEYYQSFSEAFDAMNNADIIRVVDVRAGTGQYHVYMALDKFAVPGVVVSVGINITNSEVDLWTSIET